MTSFGKKVTIMAIVPYCVDKFPVGVDVRSTLCAVNCLLMSILRLCWAMKSICDCWSINFVVTSQLSFVMCM